MVGEQPDVMPEQVGNSSLLDPCDGGTFAAPEIAVMDEKASAPQSLAASSTACEAVTAVARRSTSGLPSICKPFGQ